MDILIPIICFLFGAFFLWVVIKAIKRGVVAFGMDNSLWDVYKEKNPRFFKFVLFFYLVITIISFYFGVLGLLYILGVLA